MDTVTKFMKIAKYILILILFAFFLKAFAEPSYRKWLKKDVVVTESVDYHRGPESPALTICLKKVNTYYIQTSNTAT